MRFAVLLTVLYAVSSATAASAAVLASDDASQPAYSLEAGGAWKGLNPSANENPAGTDNGGYGFLPWSFAGGYHDPTLSPYGRLNHFIDGIDFPASSFNNLVTPAFGLTNANGAYRGFTSRATRVFPQPLAVGGTISLQFDNPLLSPLKPNDETGIVIRLNSGGGAKIPANANVNERFGFFVTDGFNGGYWNKTDAAGITNTGLVPTQTSSGAVFEFTLTSVESYRFEILPLAGGPALYSTTGNLVNPGASIDTLEIVMFGNGSGNGAIGLSAVPTGAREFFFNNLHVESAGSVVVLDGDYNDDGVVDAADYVVWRTTFGQSVTPGSGADGDASGEVNDLDYGVWRRNFGSPAPAIARLSLAVPEPIALVPSMIGFALGLSWARSRNRPRRPALHRPLAR